MAVFDDLFEKYDLKWDWTPPSNSEALLIGSSGKLPNRQTVELRQSSSFEEWVAKAHDVWVGLQKPSLRFFLPSEFSTDGLMGFWPEPELQGHSIGAVNGR